MNVEELWGLSKWAQAEIAARKIHELYSGLTAALRQNAQPNQARSSFDAQKTALLTALRQIDLSTLTREQVEFLGRLNIAQHLGEAGAKQVERTLTEYSLDIVTAGNKLEQVTTAFSAAQERFNQLRAALTNVVDAAPEPLSGDEVLIRVTFAGDAKIGNVVELQHWSDEWLKISRGIAMSHDAAPETVRVVSASRGSIVLEMAMAVLLAKTASAIILEALKVSERVLGIMKQYEIVRGMHLTNKQIATDLKKEAEKERKEGTEAVSQKIIVEVNLDPKTQGDKVAALRASIGALVKFLTNGGEVDCVVPDSPAQQADGVKTARAEIAQAFKEIRVLQEDQRRIEHAPEEE